MKILTILQLAEMVLALRPKTRIGRAMQVEALERLWAECSTVLKAMGKNA